MVVRAFGEEDGAAAFLISEFLKFETLLVMEGKGGQDERFHVEKNEARTVPLLFLLWSRVRQTITCNLELRTYVSTLQNAFGYIVLQPPTGLYNRD